MKKTVHIVSKEIMNPTNPVSVNLIGAGGTGGQVLTALGRMNHALLSLNHPGFHVKVFDDDKVEPVNLGRQLFTTSEIGQYKCGALISRLNRFFGTNWKAIPELYSMNLLNEHAAELAANITISCVDSVKARFEISDVLKYIQKDSRLHRDQSLYWMDFGNSHLSGQVVLSTTHKIVQPKSKKYKTQSFLPPVTSEFSEILVRSEIEDNTPSCSLGEALNRQDLFINSSLANIGASLLWQLFREGIIFNRGFFLNLKDFRTQPLPVT